MNNPFVIHIHGSINDCNSLVFTVKQYLETYSRSNEKFYENLKNSIEYLLNDSKKRDVMSEAALDISKNWSCKSYYYDFINLIGDIDE